MKNISEVEAFRAQRGLTQGQLAVRFGMDMKSGQVSISRMEKGKQNVPGIMRALMDEIEEVERLRAENEALKTALRALSSPAAAS
jgi:transcriptional regulator with XRE-family HTH domain